VTKSSGMSATLPHFWNRTLLGSVHCSNFSSKQLGLRRDLLEFEQNFWLGWSIHKTY